MAGKRNDRSYGFYVRLMMIGDDRCGGQFCTGQGTTKKRLCTRPVAFVPQEYINNLSVLIHRAI